MVDRRALLGVLTRQSLLGVARTFQITGVTGHTKEEIIDALADVKAFTNRELLGVLKRDELKAACRAAGLRDQGREKALLINRLLGREEEPAWSAAPRPDPPAQGPRHTQRSNGKVQDFRHR